MQVPCHGRMGSKDVETGAAALVWQQRASKLLLDPQFFSACCLKAGHLN